MTLSKSIKPSGWQTRWLLPSEPPADVNQSLARFTPTERTILYRRGISTQAAAEDFLSGKLIDSEDPFLMTGMGKAVRRILQAIEHKEQIVVYGDYDADGVTATALLVGHLQGLGAQVWHYIPNRFDEGYGLNQEALADLRQAGAALVITVDCGIRAIDQVAFGNTIGLDVIVTDHHHPGAVLPAALAVLNPKQEGDAYPFKGFAGVGLAYKLAQAINRRMSQPDPLELLDLVAVGTVADLAPLKDENRVLVLAGLERLRKVERVGFKALIETAGITQGSMRSSNIGFGIGPRLNAAGRLETAEKAFRLLTTNDAEEAAQNAAALEMINRERQQIMRETVERARSLGVEGEIPPDLIFVVDAEFNEGVVGLAASRLTDEFYRPSIVAVLGDENTKASGRSIPEFHITEALEACSDLLERFGGHSAAAGFSVSNQNLHALELRLKQLAAERLAGLDLHPTLEIDAVVKFPLLDWPLYEFIESVEPCGEGNPTPVFAAGEVQVLEKRAVGKEGRHLKLTLKQDGKPFDAIAFRQGDLLARLPDYVDLAFRLERNDYWNYPSLELNVLDFHPAGSIGANMRDSRS